MCSWKDKWCFIYKQYRVIEFRSRWKHQGSWQMVASPALLSECDCSKLLHLRTPIASYNVLSTNQRDLQMISIFEMYSKYTNDILIFSRKRKEFESFWSLHARPITWTLDLLAEFKSTLRFITVLRKSTTFLYEVQRTWVGLCAICSGQRSTETGLSPSSLVFPCQY